jgi:hypothetical protein
MLIPFYAEIIISKKAHALAPCGGGLEYFHRSPCES